MSSQDRLNRVPLTPPKPAWLQRLTDKYVQWRARHVKGEKPRPPYDKVDESSRESFPASDPPAW